MFWVCLRLSDGYLEKPHCSYSHRISLKADSSLHFIWTAKLKVKMPALAAAAKSFPSPMHESEKRKWRRSVHPTLSDPMDYIAYQAPPSMGFSRQEYWNGLPLPSPLALSGFSQILSLKMGYFLNSRLIKWKVSIVLFFKKMQNNMHLISYLVIWLYWVLVAPCETF